MLNAMPCVAFAFSSALQLGVKMQFTTRPGQARADQDRHGSSGLFKLPAGLCLRARRDNELSTKQKKSTATIVIKSNANQNDKYLGKK